MHVSVYRQTILILNRGSALDQRQSVLNVALAHISSAVGDPLGGERLLLIADLVYIHADIIDVILFALGSLEADHDTGLAFQSSLDALGAGGSGLGYVRVREDR